MNSFYILFALAIIASLLAYFLLLGTFNVLKKIVESTKGGLKGICAILCLTMVLYIVIHHENADEMMDQIQFWEDEATINADQINWKPE